MNNVECCRISIWNVVNDQCWMFYNINIECCRIINGNCYKSSTMYDSYIASMLRNCNCCTWYVIYNDNMYVESWINIVEWQCWLFCPTKKIRDVDNFLFFHWLNLHTWTPYDFLKLTLTLIYYYRLPQQSHFFYRNFILNRVLSMCNTLLISFVLASVSCKERKRE